MTTLDKGFSQAYIFEEKNESSLKDSNLFIKISPNTPLFRTVSVKSSSSVASSSSFSCHSLYIYLVPDTVEDIPHNPTKQVLLNMKLAWNTPTYFTNISPNRSIVQDYMSPVMIIMALTEYLLFATQQRIILITLYLFIYLCVSIHLSIIHITTL